MSGWNPKVTHNFTLGGNKPPEPGRRSSIEAQFNHFFTRLRTGSGGVQFFSRNKNISKSPMAEIDTDFPKCSIPKNFSAPMMENYCQDMELTIVETPLLIHKDKQAVVVKRKRKKKDVSIIPMNVEVDPRAESKVWQKHGNNHLGLVLSALYAKLLVVCGTGFSLAEVISTYIPAAYYDGFYLYLYFMSIVFMTCILGNVIKKKAHRHAKNFAQGVQSRRSQSKTREGVHSSSSASSFEASPPKQSLALTVALPTPGDIESKSSSDFSAGRSSSPSPPLTPIQTDKQISTTKRRPIKTRIEVGSDMEIPRERDKGTHFGSFYLRMGAVAFGVGSMIYSGLEFGQYFELKPDEKCHSYMLALTPVVRMIFTFMQMYFIFLNSKMAVSKVSLTSQFGLMHMIGTNLCVWLNCVVQETRHEILNFYDPDNKTISFRYEKAHKAYLNIHDHDDSIINSDTLTTTTTNYMGPQINHGHENHLNDNLTAAKFLVQHRFTRGLKGPHTMMECGRTNIMGSIVQDAAPFLFPCTIEFSLICAAICYVMWKSMAKRRTANQNKLATHSELIASRSPHHYTVDCARANKGLFVGIFFLVLTIMSIIINLVLDTREEYRVMAHLEVNITEIVLYTSASIAVIIGMCQVRVLRYAKQRNLELDNILLIVSQTGSLIFNIFTIISGHFKGEKLVLILALSKVIQLLLQTLFILDASNRQASTYEQAKKKPGREVVTYLLVTNLAMWLMNALEKSRGENHPSQLQFFGVWGWTIITHISMPLAIFYRFHSTVCLCEIWKRAFKLKRI